MPNICSWCFSRRTLLSMRALEDATGGVWCEGADSMILWTIARAPIAAAVILLSLVLSGPVRAQQPVELPASSFNAHGSSLKGYVYVSEGARARGKAPLLVVLHGCEQEARTFFADAGWKELADAQGLIALLPAQATNLLAMAGGVNRTGNPLGCFNFADRLVSPIKGGVPREAGAIASMIEAVRKGKGIVPPAPEVDAERVYVTGLSAGAAMAAVLIAEYPQVFAGGALFAGVPVLCASSMQSAAYLCGISVMRACNDVKARKEGYDARDWQGFINRPSRPKGSPRVLIVQGTADCTVDPENARHLTRQWTTYHGLSPDTPATSGPMAPWPDRAVQNSYAPAGMNDPLVQVVHLKGVGHVMPIDTSDSKHPCGTVRQANQSSGQSSGQKTYIEDVGVCGAAMAADFFHLLP